MDLELKIAGELSQDPTRLTQSQTPAGPLTGSVLALIQFDVCEEI